MNVDKIKNMLIDKKVGVVNWCVNGNSYEMSYNYLNKIILPMAKKSVEPYHIYAVYKDNLYFAVNEPLSNKNKFVKEGLRIKYRGGK